MWRQLTFPLLHRSGSSSQVYDNEGRFQPVKFEEIFTKFDKGALPLPDHLGRRHSSHFSLLCRLGTQYNLQNYS